VTVQGWQNADETSLGARMVMSRMLNAAKRERAVADGCG